MTQKTQEDTSPNGNIKGVIRARIWHIVINNFTPEDLKSWKELCDQSLKYVWQEEIGKDTKTPHIQGHIEFKNPKKWTTLCNKLPRACIKKVRNIKASEDYCKKLDTRAGEVHQKGFDKKQSLEERLLEIKYKDVVWKDWQKNIINVIASTPDKRKIFWILDERGNAGKSFLCKYIALKYNCIIASGKTDNIFNQVLTWRTKNPDELQIPPVIIDVPRSEFAHVNYGAIEQLKNGFLYSGKYEGGKVFGLSPHVIIVANSPYKEGQMSEDRWVNIKIEN